MGDGFVTEQSWHCPIDEAITTGIASGLPRLGQVGDVAGQTRYQGKDMTTEDQVVGPKSVIARRSRYCFFVILIAYTALYAIFYSLGDWYSDDWFLSIRSKELSLASASEPTYGHFVPGMKAIYWCIVNIFSMSRVLAGLFFGLQLLLLGVLIDRSIKLRRELGREGATLIFSPAMITCLTLGSASTSAAFFYTARGSATITATLLVVSGYALLLKALQQRVALLGVIAAGMTSVAALFWELYLVAPFFTALFVFLNVRRTERCFRVFWSFVGGSILACLLYFLAYHQNGYGSGVDPPKFGEILYGTWRFAATLVVPIVGGGPVSLSEAVPGSPLSITRWTLLTQITLVLGLVFLVNLAIKADYRSRIALLVWLLGIAFQGAVITYARFNYSGIGTYNEPRYAADVIFLSLLLLLTASTTSESTLKSSGVAKRQSLTRVVAIVVSLSGLLTVINTGQRYALNRYSKGSEWIRKSEQSLLDLCSGCTLIDGPVTSSLGMLPVPYNTARNVLSLYGYEDRFLQQGTSEPRIIETSGNLVVPTVLVSEAVSASSETCSKQLIVPELRPDLIALRTAKLEIHSPKAQRLWVQFMNEGSFYDLERGDNVVWFAGFGGRSTVSVDPTTDACLNAYEAYIFEIPHTERGSGE